MNKFNWNEYIKSRPDLKKNWNGPIRARLHYFFFNKECYCLNKIKLQLFILQNRFMNRNRKVNLITCIGVDFDIDYITHFIKYYKKFEIDSFNFILQTNIDNKKGIEKAKKIILSELSQAKIYIWSSEFYPDKKSEKINMIIKNHFYDWNLVVDVDEFVEFKENSIKKTIKRMYSDIFWGQFYDHISIDKTPKELKPNQDIFEQFPKIVFYSKKINALEIKPILFIKQYIDKSLHSTQKYQDHGLNIKKDDFLKIHHFKWIKTTKDKLKRREDKYKKKGYFWSVESKKALSTIYNLSKYRDHTDKKEINYLVLATPRSGSNLLMGLLKKKLRKNKRDFNSELFQIKKINTLSFKNVDFNEYIQAQFYETTDTIENIKINGFKILPNQIDYFLKKYNLENNVKYTWDDFFDALPPNIHFIILRCKNKIMQAISLYKANYSDNWVEYKKSGTIFSRIKNKYYKTPFNYIEINKFLKRLQKEENKIAKIIKKKSLKKIEIIYEDFSKEIEITLKNILKFLNIELKTMNFSIDQNIQRNKDDFNLYKKYKLFEKNKISEK